MLCLNHINQIKNALGITGIQALVCAWRNQEQNNKTQIDMLIDRKDDTINICEIKFAKDEFEITKEYEASLNNKINTFAKSSNTNKSLMLTMITTYGIKPNIHSNIVQNQILLEDLFKA